MKANAKRRFDSFTFWLGAVPVVSSFASIPMVSSDRIARAWDERLAGTTSLASDQAHCGELLVGCS